MTIPTTLARAAHRSGRADLTQNGTFAPVAPIDRFRDESRTQRVYKAPKGGGHDASTTGERIASIDASPPGGDKVKDIVIRAGCL